MFIVKSKQTSCSSSLLGNTSKDVYLDDNNAGYSVVSVERQVLTLTGKTVFKYFAEDIFLVQCPGSKRDRETLEIIILAHVAPGTTIYIDG